MVVVMVKVPRFGRKHLEKNDGLTTTNTEKLEMQENVDIKLNLSTIVINQSSNRKKLLYSW